MRCFLASLILLQLSACAATRITTTPRTAVEQALITQSTRQAVKTLKLSEFSGRSFYIEADDMTTQNCHEGVCQNYELSYILNALRDRLLKEGMLQAQSKELASVIVRPRIDYALIDDSESIIGLPSFPIPIPGAGNLQTPEIALFGNATQYGRTKISITGADSKTGALVFSESSTPAEVHYSRWSLLLLFSWRTTDLEKPF
jgi:hypothetical protein